MCGVAGIIDYTSQVNTIDDIKQMLRSISYRGPDGSGIYQSSFASLGNVRLSIIDIDGGQQPLCDQSGRFWIVFNGEIFNYKELRSELESLGYKFKTESDTEVLVQLYSLYGSECLKLLNGQFAFAIWDKIEEELFIARDRVGIRPLFYNISGEILSFASEIKALFKLKYVSREFNPASLDQIFTFWAALSPNTAFRNIYELTPGHFLVYNRKGLRLKEYWALDFSEIQSEISLTDASEKFNELLTSAVKLRLRADVEVAAYLSGGIDSSATVAYIKEIEPGILHTFSVGFEEKDFDESCYQKEAVHYYNTAHRSLICSSSDIADSFRDVVWHSETPITRTAPAPMMILSRLVKENNIKVVITGEGADEILAGYDIFKEAKIRRFWASQSESVTRPLLLKKLYHDIPYLRNVNPNILKLFFGYRLNEIDNPFYSHLLRWNNANHIKKHYSVMFQHNLTNYSPFNELEERLPREFESWDPLAKSQWLEIKIFMSGYLLSSQGDRMVMANSVEGRYPFLDYRVIEFCAGLPSRFKLCGLTEKFLLKKLLRNRVPENILKRPKQPYRAPVTNVFMSKKQPEYVKYLLSDTYIKEAKIFNDKSISGLISRIEKSGVASELDNMVLTAVISTHLMNHQFVENNNKEYRRGELKNLKIIEDS
jgi:asparagine synthase (glutamine-hydrolysing)